VSQGTKAKAKWIGAGSIPDAVGPVPKSGATNSDFNGSWVKSRHAEDDDMVAEESQPSGIKLISREDLNR